MNFSDLLKQSNQLCIFSPNGQFVASTRVERLLIRNVKKLQLIQSFSCIDTIEAVEWASDSCYILCGMFKRRIIQVWSLEQPNWTCKIDGGSLGIIDACWSPDGRHVLTTAKFHLRVTVWSLLNKSVFYIKYAKPGNPGLAFSPDGKYLAVAERRDCRDHISIFVCSTWVLVKHFEAETKDLGGIAWSPNSQILCVWDSFVENYKVLLYSMDERCQGSFNAYQQSLGVKCVSWSPTGQFLAVGSYDQKVRVLNHVIWKPIAEYSHTSCITTANLVIYKEIEEGFLPDNEAGMQLHQSKYEVVESRPVTLPAVPLDSSKAIPKHGIGTVTFSSDAQYLVSINDNMPTVVWIWDFKKLAFSDILLQIQPVRCAVWCPQQPRLALCTGTNKVFIWSPAGCLSVRIPFEVPFQIQSLKWHPVQDILLLIGRDNMCFCFLST